MAIKYSTEKKDPRYPTWYANKLRAVAERYPARRERFIKELGGRCAKCGRKNKLWFYYTGPLKKVPYKISMLIRSSPLRAEREKKYFGVMCRPCQRALWKNPYPRRKTHGHISLYSNQKCRCKPCSDAWYNYQINWKKNRKEKRDKAHKLLNDEKFKKLFY